MQPVTTMTTTRRRHDDDTTSCRCHVRRDDDTTSWRRGRRRVDDVIVMTMTTDDDDRRPMTSTIVHASFLTRLLREFVKLACIGAARLYHFIVAGLVTRHDNPIRDNSKCYTRHAVYAVCHWTATSAGARGRQWCTCQHRAHNRLQQ